MRRTVRELSALSPERLDALRSEHRHTIERENRQREEARRQYVAKAAERQRVRAVRPPPAPARAATRTPSPEVHALLFATLMLTLAATG